MSLLPNRDQVYLQMYCLCLQVWYLDVLVDQFDLCHLFILNIDICSFGRHSKSLNLEKKRCGYCYGKFEVFVNSNHQNQQKKVLKTPKAPSAFALFVKENYGVVKQENSNLKHGDIMKKLGEKFTSLKVKQHNS